jgi:hypothetical protein
MQLDRRFLVASAALLASAAGGPADAGSDRLEKFSFNGKLAEASFSSSDACTDTYASAFGADEVVNGASKESYANVLIYTYDFCNDIYLTDAYFYGPISSDAFHVDQNGLTAILRLEVDGHDYVTGATIPIAFSISWSASGLLYNFHHVWTYLYPSGPQTIRTRGRGRDAIATGVIKAGPTTLSKSSDYASILASTDVFINHYNP